MNFNLENDIPNDPLITKINIFNYLGLDLGKTQDYSVLTHLKAFQIHKYEKDYDEKIIYRSDMGQDPIDFYEPIRYRLQNCHRWELGTSYNTVVDDIINLLKLPYFKQNSTPLIIDATGVGSAVFDIFKSKNLFPIAITITSGNSMGENDIGYTVPKQDLLDNMSIIVNQERLKINNKIQDKKIIIGELQSFEKTINKRGNISLEAENKSKDDIVLSISYALWYAHRQLKQSQTSIKVDDSFNFGYYGIL